METILMPVKAKHFKDAVFVDNNNCGLANAAKEFFGNVGFIAECVDCLAIYTKDPNEGGKRVKTFTHPGYLTSDFVDDLANARDNNFDETVIRHIVLKEVDNDQIFSSNDY